MVNMYQSELRLYFWFLKIKQPITIKMKKIGIIHQSVQGGTRSTCSILGRHFTSLVLMVSIRGILVLLKESIPVKRLS